MGKQIAFFDFDGTITSKDSFLEFIKFTKGVPNFYAGFALHIPYIIAYKARIISNQSAKEKVLSHFFRGLTQKELQDLGNKFGEEIIPSLVRSKALQEINQLQEKGVEVVIVSASPEIWISKWATGLSLPVISTRLQFMNDRFTGLIEGLNCHGEEKVRRIKEKYDLSNYERIIAYGDTAGDKPMLALAHESFMKPFRK